MYPLFMVKTSKILSSRLRKRFPCDIKSMLHFITDIEGIITFSEPLEGFGVLKGFITPLYLEQCPRD